MLPKIDTTLQFAFTPENVAHAFAEYKLNKWDRFTGIENPTIDIPLGADGVTYKAFEKQLNRHAKNIASRVTTGKYIFYPFREVDKPKNPDQPLSESNKRTLGIASIRDALVQSILYSKVLYEPVDTLFKELDSPSPVSFAYRKGKSAPQAAKQIGHYLSEGYVHACDFDLRKFFDRIPHDQLLKQVAEIIGGTDSITYRLIRRYVRVDRVPHDSYRYIRRKQDKKYLGAKIFHNEKPKVRKPKADKGLPQGGILSGMLANVYLHKFDKWVVNELGSIHDLKYVRYADDFIILVKDPELLLGIKEQVIAVLSSVRFDLEVNDDKTKILNICVEGLDFVGFHFDGQFIRVKQSNLDKFRTRLETTLNEAYRSVDPGWAHTKTLAKIVKRINHKIEGFGRRYECPRCRCTKRDAPRNWAAFFSVITDDRQLHQLDSWIRRQIYRFIYARYGKRLSREDLKKAELKSLVGEHYRVRRASVRPCLCDIQEADNDIWQYATDLFAGRAFETLANKCHFHVPHVAQDSLQISVKGRQYQVGKDTLQKLWERLCSGEVLSRATLENQGIRNASHVVALLSELPGVESQTHPIRLYLVTKSPAHFLQP